MGLRRRFDVLALLIMLATAIGLIVVATMVITDIAGKHFYKPLPKPFRVVCKNLETMNLTGWYDINEHRIEFGDNRNYFNVPASECAIKEQHPNKPKTQKRLRDDKTRLRNEKPL